MTEVLEEIRYPVTAVLFLKDCCDCKAISIGVVIARILLNFLISI